MKSTCKELAISINKSLDTLNSKYEELLADVSTIEEIIKYKKSVRSSIVFLDKSIE